VNYLAHLFLSASSEEALVGAVLGDFVKGAVGDHYAPIVRHSILLHRKIDCYTDAHAIVRASRRLVSQQRRRFAGIMVDVFYDHFLARHWTRYTDIALNDFTHKAYAVLMRHRQHLPEPLQHVVLRMVGNDWLGAYRRLEGVAGAVNGIARRLRRENTLCGGVCELQANYRRFEEHFVAFFPELMRYSEHYKAEHALVGSERSSCEHNGDELFR
jgi:acyl carrier protein phosphodiesterase